MIDKKTIQLILDAARIEDVVGDVVQLRKRGINMTGLCPFHNEKTPSFSVSPTKGIYKCFGCGKGGDSVGFVMEHEACSYPEALRSLARKYNIEVEEQVYSQEAQNEKLRLDSLFVVNDYATKYYADQLLHTDYGKSIGLAYFKQRGFRTDIIERWQLGFAPEGYDRFTQHAVANGYNIELLKSVAVTRPDGRDFFRNRVLFPIHNTTGRVVGFGGRVMDAAQQPKYLNTSDTEIYHKSKTLFGFFFAKKAIRQRDECVLTEGYIDVITLHQAGIENVVASSGTSLTIEQLQLIKRHTNNLKILYDGDKAGIKAAVRGLDLALEQGLNVKIVLIPDGEDPDSYLKAIGTSAFEEFMLREAKDFIAFKTDLILKEAEGDPIVKVKLARDLIESIAKIPDPVTRAVYTKACSAQLGMDEKLITEEVNKLLLQEYKQNQARQYAPQPQVTLPSEDTLSAGTPVITRAEPTSQHEFQEKEIARILVLYGERRLKDGTPLSHYVLAKTEEYLEVIDNKLYQLVAKTCLELLERDELPNAQYFVTHENADLRHFAVQVLSMEDHYGYSENWEKRWDKPLSSQVAPDENYEKEMLEVVTHFLIAKTERLIEENMANLKAAPPDDQIIYLHIHQQLLALLTPLRNELKIEGAKK